MTGRYVDYSTTMYQLPCHAWLNGQFTFSSSCLYISLPFMDKPLRSALVHHSMSIRSSSAVNGTFPFLGGCVEPTSRIVPAGGPARYSSRSSSAPLATDCSINFQDIEPGGVSFRTWSAIIKSACFSICTTSPPFDCEHVSNLRATQEHRTDLNKLLPPISSRQSLHQEEFHSLKKCSSPTSAIVNYSSHVVSGCEIAK